MAELEKIQKSAQHAVSVIAAAFGVEVALIDSEFNLIAKSRTFLETFNTRFFGK